MRLPRLLLIFSISVAGIAAEPVGSGVTGAMQVDEASLTNIIVVDQAAAQADDAGPGTKGKPLKTFYAGMKRAVADHCPCCHRIRRQQMSTAPGRTPFASTGIHMSTLGHHHSDFFARSARAARAAFSLTELLVVVAVIALLVAMLLPAINSTREGAKRLQCANNLSQISVANFAYSADNNGSYVLAVGWGPLPSGSMDTWWLGNMAFAEKLGFRTTTNTDSGKWPKRLMCPGAVRAVVGSTVDPSFSYAMRHQGDGWQKYSYTYDADGNEIATPLGPNIGVATYPNYKFIRVGTLATPSETAMMADALNWNGLGTAPVKAYTGEYPKPQDRKVAFRHRNTASVVYFDGRAQALQWSEFNPTMNTLSHPFYKLK